MRSLSFWGGLDRVFELIVSQGVGFADVLSGTAESKQALTLRMPKENVALGYVLLTLRGGSPLSGGLTFCPIN